MIIVSMVQTFDGKLHKDTDDAKRHLDRLYADKLCPLGGHLAQIDKYTAACEFIDANLAQFVELQRIRDDMKVEEP